MRVFVQLMAWWLGVMLLEVLRQGRVPGSGPFLSSANLCAFATPQVPKPAMGGPYGALKRIGSGRRE